MLNAFLRRGRDRSWANRRKRPQWRLLVEREAARRLRQAHSGGKALGWAPLKNTHTNNSAVFYQIRERILCVG
jgi:hypothetical protein